MTADAQQPTSWRDVYALVRDTHADLMVAIGNVDTKVTNLQERVVVIEDDRRDEKVARQTEALVAAARNRRLMTAVNISRGTIALFISLGAFVLSVFKS